MARSVILIRLILGWEDIDAARDYVRDMEAALQGFPGYEGSGAWKGVGDPHARLILFSYESEAAARAGFASIGEMPSLIERQNAGAEPADVKVLRVEEADGRFDGAIPADHSLSFSVRLAEPGYGAEMVEDYQGVFGGLSPIPGYAGGLIGTNVKMPEEVVGLVAWRNERAFASSMPENPTYDVYLYEPVDVSA